MKQLVKVLTATVLFSIAIFNNATAQEKNTMATIQSPGDNHSYFATENNLPTSNAVTNSVVTAKFSTLFPNAASQKWVIGSDSYQVSFLNNGRNTKASFTQKGKLNYTITDCAKEHLPATLNKTIEKDYSVFKVLNAIEITAHGTVAYQVILESSKSFITLKHTDDGVEEIQVTNKQ